MTYAEMLPPNGALVKLVDTPRGSWATAGETYRVSYAPTRRKGQKVIHSQTTVRLWNEHRGCGTFDAALFWKWARFEVVEA